MRLPNALDAYVSSEKVSAYRLNAEHPDGASKAAFFRAFGFASARPQALIDALREHPLRNAVFGEAVTGYGHKHLVRCGLRTPDGRDPCILSVWITEPGEPGPRLVTAYPDR